MSNCPLTLDGVRSLIESHLGWIDLDDDRLPGLVEAACRAGVEAERERCARVCEGIDQAHADRPMQAYGADHDGLAYDEGFSCAAEQCAAASARETLVRRQRSARRPAASTSAREMAAALLGA